MIELALQWLMSQAHVNSVIHGASKIEHLKENLKATDGKLDDVTLKACDDVWKNIRGDHFQYNR